MTFEPAYEKALADVAALNPFAAAAKSGTSFDNGKFRVPFFNRVFQVSYPEAAIEEVGVAARPPRYLELLLLHYLVCSDGSGVADSWITYRMLPGASLFEQRFQTRAIVPLARTFGNDVERFKKAAESIGGIPMSRTGDAAYRFLAFPKLPVGCILYLGEEDMPGSVNILFDEAAPHYLPTEDLSIVGGYLSGALRGYQIAMT